MGGLGILAFKMSGCIIARLKGVRVEQSAPAS
jgi:hypothetical protein